MEESIDEDDARPVLKRSKLASYGTKYSATWFNEFVLESKIQFIISTAMYAIRMLVVVIKALLI